MKDSKRSLSLCSSEYYDEEEPEYQEEVEDSLPVLNDQSQLLDDQHLERVSVQVHQHTLLLSFDRNLKLHAINSACANYSPLVFQDIESRFENHL